jgi:hypothetical protein
MTDAAHLTSGVLAAVLGAALLHALWNSLVKSADDKFLSSALIALWCGVAAFAATLVLPWPSRAAAPFIAASALIHIVYFLLVGAAPSQCRPVGRLFNHARTCAVDRRRDRSRDL